MSSYSTIKKLSIICLIGGLIIWVLYPFIYPILFAGLLAIILAPVQQHLELHLSANKSSFLIVITILLCVFIPILTVTSYAITESISYIQHPESLSQTFSRLGDSIAKIPYIGIHLQEHFDKIVAILKEDKEKIISNLLLVVRYISSTSISLIVDFLIILLLIYQFLISRKSFEKFFKKVIFKDFDDRDNFISAAIMTTRRVSLAIFLTAAVVAIVMSITFLLIGLPSPILFASISAIASMVPFMAGIVYILLASAVFILFGATKAIIILVVGFSLNIFTDSLMQPKIINKQVELSFVASLMGIMGGIEAFGFIGVFLGPIIFNITFVGIEKLMDKET